MGARLLEWEFRRRLGLAALRLRYGWGDLEGLVGLGWGLGMGLGWGLSSWMFGPMLYNWGYSNYYNPYYGGYGTAATPSSHSSRSSTTIRNRSTRRARRRTKQSFHQSMTIFDSAREAFKAGDYARALDLVDQALKTTPNDAALHEFRGLCLFALKRYDEAAATLYAVLVGRAGLGLDDFDRPVRRPGNVHSAAAGARGYCSQNPQSAAGRFVLAYQYLTQGHAEAAVRQLQIVTYSSAQGSVRGAVSSAAPENGPDGCRHRRCTGTRPAAAATTPAVSRHAPAGIAGKLEGIWTAQPSPDTTITVTFRTKGISPGK